MLSHLPHRQSDSNDDNELSGPDITNKMFDVSMINSSNSYPKTFAQYDDQIIDNQYTKEDVSLLDYDLVTEQTQEKKLLKIKEELQGGKASQAIKRKYILLDNVFYYLSKTDSDPVIWLYIPEHLWKEVIEQYYDNNGHMGINKTQDTIKIKYYWPNMYKNIYQYVTSCVTCQTRNLRKVKPPQQETDAPPYPLAKLGLDVSGTYPKTLSGNKYMIGFVDWYSGWPEAFAVHDKTAKTVVHLLLEEIIPRYSTPLQIVTDNDSEILTG